MFNCDYRITRNTKKQQEKVKDTHNGGRPQSQWFDISLYTIWNRRLSLSDFFFINSACFLEL